MSYLLTEAHQAMDVQSALKILIFSNNFYIEEPGSNSSQKQREYVQYGISKHKIWQDFKFWERAIYESIQQDLQETKNFEGDKSAMAKQIVFAKLLSLEHDMLCFDLDKAKIKELIGIFGQSYKLP